MGDDARSTMVTDGRAVSDAVAVLLMVTITFSVVLLLGLFVLGQ